MSYVGSLTTQEVTDNSYTDMFKQYEHVVMESLITAFGLDFFIKDQHGGDVDTIHSVRSIGEDSKMGYKNPANQKRYEDRGNYDNAYYHKGGVFQKTKHEARTHWDETGQGVTDVYSGGEVHFWRHGDSTISKSKAELDHVVECKMIHDDRGRVLAGFDGKDLADCPENFAWTNKSLNSSMGSWALQENEKYKKIHGCDAPMEKLDAKAYVEAHPELDAKTKENIVSTYEKARNSYESKLNRAYYTSKGFLSDTGKAAAKTGALMGLRQALGFVFSEIWFSVKAQIVNHEGDEESLFIKIGNGIKQGLKNAKDKFGDIWHKFIEGAVSGVLSSITTTICNIFFSTAKSVVRIIRQTWASLVQALKILLFNPDNLPLGERVRAASKVLATAASVVAGIIVSEAIAKTPLGAIPVVGEIVQTFCGTLVTGIMSCTLLYILDHNKLINKAVRLLDSFSSGNLVNFYKQQSLLLEKYCAELMNINVQTLRKEVDSYSEAVDILEHCQTETQLNVALKSIYQKMNIELPWDGVFIEFMGNRNNTLHFR